MERTEEVDTPAPSAELFAVVEDLGRYPDWLDIVVAASPVDPLPGDEGPAWSVELRGRVGPLARSKRLPHGPHRPRPGSRAVFERREPGERPVRRGP